MIKAKNNPIILAIMLAAAMVVPFGNDIYLAGFQQISQQFHTTHAQFVMSVFLLGLSLMQPICGPLTDRFGRRPVLIGSLSLFCLSSLLIVLTPYFSIVLLARFFQAVGACAAFVTVLAMIRDAYHEHQLIMVMSIFMAAVGVSPALAPLIGSYLTFHFGWQSNFYFLFCYGALFFILSIFAFRETIAAKNETALHFKQMLINYASLICRKDFMSFCLTSAGSYGALFSYFSVAPIIIMNQFGFSMVAFGWISAINAIAIVSMAAVAPRLAKQFGGEKIMRVGTFLIVFGSLFMLVINFIMKNTIFTFMVPMFVVTMGIGLIRPTAISGALKLIPKNIAGTGASLFNVFSFIGGALSTAIVALFISHVQPYAILALFLGLFALISAQIKLKRQD